jgi:dihydrolipoamide dehydrogenase
MAAPDAPGQGFRRRTPLSVVFASPQLARVGPPLSDLPKDVVIGEVDFSRQGRARIAALAAGMLRVYARPSDGRLLGAEMCAPAAEHMAHLLALAVEHRMSVPQILAMPFYHPVLEEGLRSALRDLARRLPDSGGSDLSQCGDIGHDALD